jgi:hypothetical protein
MQYRYVVKGGLNYGVDFTVYKTTPLWCHSEICAMVVDARHEEDEQKLISWNQIVAQTRITQVSFDSCSIARLVTSLSAFIGCDENLDGLLCGSQNSRCRLNRRE